MKLLGDVTVSQDGELKFENEEDLIFVTKLFMELEIKYAFEKMTSNTANRIEQDLNNILQECGILAISLVDMDKNSIKIRYRQLDS